jgi:hypothetical protein
MRGTAEFIGSEFFGCANLSGILWIPGIMRQGHKFQLNSAYFSDQAKVISGHPAKIKRTYEIKKKKKNGKGTQI